MIFKRTARNNAVGPMVQDQSTDHTSSRRSIVYRVTFALLSGVSGMAAATQFFADQFDNHPSLGLHFGGYYAPWKIFEWAARFYEAYPNAVLQAGSVGMVTTVVLLFLMVAARMLRVHSSKPNEFLHGSARWADPEHIERAGLLSTASDSVFVGAYLDRKGNLVYLRHSGPEHVLCYAPTRSGKGVGLVVPTLLSWGQSAIITDLKGELWALTAGWRQKHGGNKVIRFEPAVSSSAAWNPLAEIRRTEGEGGAVEFHIGDIQNIATLIVDPDGRGLDSHWQKTSFALLTGVILHAKYLEHHTGTPATLPAIRRLLSDPARPTLELWKEMLTYEHANGQTNEVVAQTARDMLDSLENGPEEASSIVSTAKSYLGLYADPVVAANVSRCDFRIKDLMHHDDPVSLYIVTQPNDKARLRPLVRVLANMTVRLLADRMEFADGRPVAAYKHRLLAMFDEFTSLGKMEILQESLAFVAGYGIKFYIIIQDLSQIRAREAYGPDESITSNCHIQTAFPPNRLETADHLSKLTGTTTIVKEQVTTSGKRASAVLQNVSRTYQEVSRPLLTPDEAMRMPGPKKDAAGMIVEAGDMVVYAAGYPAIYGKQPLYFLDPVFKARAAVPPPAETDRTVARTAEVRVSLAAPLPPADAAPVPADTAE